MPSSPNAPSSLAAQIGEAPAPLYARVKQMISQQIQSGAWPPHYRVPSESELVNELGFSRMTINRALRELTAEGLLVRMQESYGVAETPEIDAADDRDEPPEHGA